MTYPLSFPEPLSIMQRFLVEGTQPSQEPKEASSSSPLSQQDLEQEIWFENPLTQSVFDRIALIEDPKEQTACERAILIWLLQHSLSLARAKLWLQNRTQKHFEFFAVFTAARIRSGLLDLKGFKQSIETIHCNFDRERTIEAFFNHNEIYMALSSQGWTFRDLLSETANLLNKFSLKAKKALAIACISIFEPDWNEAYAYNDNTSSQTSTIDHSIRNIQGFSPISSSEKEKANVNNNSRSDKDCPTQEPSQAKRHASQSRRSASSLPSANTFSPLLQSSQKQTASDNHWSTSLLLSSSRRFRKSGNNR